MKDFFLLLKLTLRNRLAFLRKGSLRRADGRIDVGKIAATLACALAFLVVAAMLIIGEVALFSLLKAVGQPALLPALALLACMVMTLLLSFFHMMSSLYFSRDTAWLSYLPVRPHAIFAAKFTEVWAVEAAFSVAVLTPAFVMYGMHLGAGVWFYLRMIPVILLASAIPLTVIALLTTVLASLTALSRHKEAWTMGGSMVMALGIVALEMSIMPRIPDDADLAYFIALFMREEGLVNAIAGSFPPVKWAVNGVRGDVLAYLLFVGLCVALLAALVWLLGGRYLGIALKQSEQSTRKRKRRGDDRDFAQRTATGALFRREFSEILRTPAYAMNCFGGVIMLPLMAAVMLLGASSEVNIPDLLAEMNMLISGLHAGDMALIAAAVMCLGASINPAAATAVSREGGRLTISRMIPVPALAQLRAKQLCGLVTGGAAIPVALIMCAVLANSQPLALILGLALALLFNYASTTFSLVLDTLRPNFTWTNEVQVIKQGTNVAFGMLISFAMLALPVVVVFLLGSVDGWVRLAAVAGILLTAAIAAEMLLRLIGAKRYAALEA